METILEQRVEEAFRYLGIPQDKKEIVKAFFTILKAKDKPTYYHSLRNSLYGIELAEMLHLNPIPLFYGGGLHDVGKIVVPEEGVCKTENFGPVDRKKMSVHSLRSYQLLRDIFWFTSEIVLRHHTFAGPNGYPKVLPKGKYDISRATQFLIEHYARVLAVIDFYDSASTRENEQWGEPGKKVLPSPEQVKGLLIKFNKDQERMINAAYERGIFGRPIEEVFGKPRDGIHPDMDVHRLVTLHEQTAPLPERVARRVMLACAMEPLPNKEGCTTRYIDIKDSKTLEMFVAGAVNVGFPFMHMADYLETRKSPKGAYQFMKHAQIESKELRAGGKINQGMLEFITPLVIAQVLTDPGCKGNPYDLFDKAVELLKDTEKEDVRELIAMKIIGNKESRVEHKYPVREHDVENVFDYYSRELDIEKAEGKPTSIYHNRQFVEGFPEIKKAFEIFLNSKNQKFAGRVEEAYDAIMKENKCRIGVGLAADFIAAMLYVAFSYSKDPEIIN